MFIAMVDRAFWSPTPRSAVISMRRGIKKGKGIMTEYGPPKNFKVIDIDTGEWVAPIDWYENPFVVDHNGYGVTEGYLDFKNVKMYQSTGHHDAHKNEVFGGDVLVHFKQGFAEYFEVTYSVGGFYLAGISTDKTGLISKPILPQDGARPFYGRMGHKVGQMIVIGNVHTPQEVLKQRAEELEDART